MSYSSNELKNVSKFEGSTSMILNNSLSDNPYTEKTFNKLSSLYANG
ncbi:MAG: hypothetical protein QW292_12325 [Candidatus Parvarchaeota archaeon]